MALAGSGRRLGACGLVLIVLAACGGSLSLTEYAEELEAVGASATDRFDRVEAIYEDENAALEDVRLAVKESARIRHDFHEELEAIEPPDQMAELHGLLIEVHAKIVDANQTWADTAENAQTTEEILENAELLAFVEIGAVGLELCRQFQAAFDATKERAELENVPWLPREMKESVEVAFGC